MNIKRDEREIKDEAKRCEDKENDQLVIPTRLSIPLTKPVQVSLVKEDHQKSSNKRLLFSHGGWTFSTIKGPILSSDKIQMLSSELGFPMPDMVFGDNAILLEYGNTPSCTTPFRCSINTADALASVLYDPQQMSQSKLSMADRWSDIYSSRGVQTIIKPYDWTFQPRYFGTGLNEACKLPLTPNHRINQDLLLRRDPILFYDHVIFYEDELADNGTCIYSGRIRVMPSCFLILIRYYLRIERAIIRVHDVRLFHEFNTNVLIRSCQKRQVDDATLCSFVKEEHMSRMVDSDFVCRLMTDLSTLSSTSTPRSVEVLEEHEKMDVFDLSIVKTI